MNARLRIVPAGLLAQDYEVLDNGAPVGRIENSPLRLREKGRLTANARQYVVVREGVLRAGYLLREAGGTIRARAERTGWSGSD